MIIWKLRDLFLKEVHHGNTNCGPRLYHLIMEVGQTLRLIDISLQPHIIVLVFFWAALHERSVKWACNPRHWSTTSLRPGRLPSPSTMWRSLRRVDTAMLMRALVERLRGRGPAAHRADRRQAAAGRRGQSRPGGPVWPRGRDVG